MILLEMSMIPYRDGSVRAAQPGLGMVLERYVVPTLLEVKSVAPVPLIAIAFVSHVAARVGW